MFGRHFASPRAGVKRSIRVIGMAVLVSGIVGTVTASIVALIGESSETVQYHLTTTPGLGDLFILGLLASAPVSLPGGIMGGVLAAAVLSRQRAANPIVGWVPKGAVAGALLGATVASLVYGFPSFGTPAFAPLLHFTAPLAAATGALVGAAVGCYCQSRLTGATGNGST